MKFIEHAKNEIEKTLINKIESRECPDQYIGVMRELRQDKRINKRIDINRRPSEKCLIIILESPHINEFGDTPCPANGKTGKNIANFIHEVKDLSNYDDFGIILINAVQFQCSLGLKTDLFRDQIFCSVWNDFGKGNFQKRLKSIISKEDIIVNCCTKGACNPSLRELVDDSIVELKLSNIILRRSHPSSWHYKKSQNYVWKK